MFDFILHEDQYRKDRNNWINYSDNNGYIELMDNKGKIRAKYKWVDPNLVNYFHFIENRILSQGTLKFVERPYFLLEFNPETYEEMLKKPKELIRIGIWKEFNDNGNVIFEREYNNGLLISEKGG